MSDVPGRTLKYVENLEDCSVTHLCGSSHMSSVVLEEPQNRAVTSKSASSSRPSHATLAVFLLLGVDGLANVVPGQFAG